MTLHRVQRGEGGVHALKQLLRADPAERTRARHAQQVQPDVGGRGAVRHHVVGRDLQVVGRQVAVVGADAAFKEAPGVARDAVQVVLVRRRQLEVVRRRWRPADPPGPDRRGAPGQAQQQRQAGRGRADVEQRAEQHGRHQRRAPVALQHRTELCAGRGLRRRGGGPFQQMAAAHRQAVERAHDGIDGHQRLLQQLREQPQPAADGARQIDAGLAVEMQLGDVVAAGRETGHGAHQRPGRKRPEHQRQGRPRRQRGAAERQQQQRQRGRCDQRTAQVVVHLPAVDGAQRIAPRPQQQRQQLPVAARPAVHARGRHVGMERRILQH